MNGPRDAYSAAELAEMKLPGLPGTKRSIARQSVREAWPFKTDLRKGGSVRLFPTDSLPFLARRELARRTAKAPGRPRTYGPRLAVEDKARVVDGMRELVKGGSSERAAAATVAPGLNRSTAVRWFRMANRRDGWSCPRRTRRGGPRVRRSSDERAHVVARMRQLVEAGLSLRAAAKEAAPELSWGAVWGWFSAAQVER